MNDISLHILDVAENSIQAGAKNIEIFVVEDSKEDLFTLEINDDGKGMDDETAENIKSPFETSRTTRKVGLGIPLLKEAAENCGGNMVISSKKGLGTKVKVTFQYGNIDRKPLGDIAETLVALILRADDTEILYSHKKDGREFIFSTKDLKRDLKVRNLKNAELLNSLKVIIKQKFSEIQ